MEISDVNQQSKLKLLKQNDKISYISCGSTKNTMTLNEWDDACVKYFQRYYEPHKKINFPPQKNENSCQEKLAQKLLENLESQEGHICLFKRYDLVHHIRLHIGCAETYHKLLKDLLIPFDQDWECNDNRMLLFNVKHNLMLNIRITESTDIDSIHEEERRGQSDLKLLLFLNQRFIKSTGVTLANIVLSPNISLGDGQNYCKNCLIIDQIILNSDREIFRRWWKTHIIPKLKPQINITDGFTQIISAVFGFMGTRQVNINDCGDFPKFRRDNTMEGDEHEEITNLMFTFDQSRVINDPALKKIVFGGFGVGKSLVGKMI